jgi:ankyrin repeat protein
MGCRGSKGAEVEQKTNYTENAPPPKAAADEPVDYKPIHSAIRWNKSVAEVERLLSSVEAANCENPDNGNKPIHIAAQNGHSELVELLLRKKADINAKNLKGNTALHMSIGYDYYETSQILIRAGADQEMLNTGDIPAKYGIDDGKSLGKACLSCAKTAEDVLEGFDLIERDLAHCNKGNFVQAGLKAKKQLGSEWSNELQERLKSITTKV